MGGWRFQIRGGNVQPLDGPAAEEALARHLAVRHPNHIAGPELQHLLSRKPGKSIPRQSLHVAANKLRDLLAKAAPDKRDGKRLAKELLPNATSAVEGGSRVSCYGFASEAWVDLFDTRDALAFRCLPADREDRIELGGGERSQPFNGFEQLAAEARECLERAALTRVDLPGYLKRFTPPIRRLEDLVPIALDRLQPNSMLVIEGRGNSGRMHLSEAIELAALTWDGRTAEQIRDLPEGTPSPDHDSPGALYTLDLTRPLKKSQKERLRKIRAYGDEVEDPESRPSLLVVAEESPSQDFSGWNRPEPISLPPPGKDEVTEAYLIATRSTRRDAERREEEFEALAREFAEEQGTEVGLRAASSAASFVVDERRVPTVGEISPAEDPPLDELEAEVREIALALVWFGNDPFTMADARAATGRPGLLRSEVFRVATNIPGGGAGTYEMHPKLIEEAPATEVPKRLCEYLLEGGNEEAAERWPMRAVRILSAQSVDPQSRLRLASVLIYLARDLGFARELEKKTRTLLRKVDPDTPNAIWGTIGRARLLMYMGDLGTAEAVLKPITKAGANAPKDMRAEAHLRLAIAASQRGNRSDANKHAEQARKLSPKKLGARVRRYYGWEALYTARFEKAVRTFKQAPRAEDDAENTADAMIGALLALLRLGRLSEAEEVLGKLAHMSGLRKITRNRIIRAEATAKYLRRGPRAGIEILDKALGKDESRASRQSADLLEARAYLYAKLGGDALTAAERDLTRSESLLVTEDEWQKAVIFYLRGLITEARMHASSQPSGDLRHTAVESAQQSVAAARANPWHQARAHTLLGRLEIDGERKLLSEHLTAAVDAHRALGALCPDALRETLELGAMASAAWQLDDERHALERQAVELAPRDEPENIDLAATLALLDRVSETIGTQPRPAEKAPAATVRILGKLGEALLRGGSEILARGVPLTARVLVPRNTPELAARLYDLNPSTGELVPTPDLPLAGPSILLGSANRRFAEQRLGVIFLVSVKEDALGESGLLHLGQWLEAFRSDARKDGIATIESIAIEPAVLKALNPLGFVALGLAELPSLG
jgi:tetratricopeptide (TPR) repeat protein